MKLLTAALLAGGLALFAWLIARQGAGEVLHAVGAAGWGIAVVVLYHFLPVTLDAMGWRSLVARDHRPRFGTAVRIRWIGESVNGLLPAAQLVAEFVRFRQAILAGIPAAPAGASITADLTIAAFSQIAFTFAGLALLYAASDWGVHGAAPNLILGLLVVAIFFAAFLVLQNIGLFGRIAGVLGRATGGSTWLKVLAGADALDAELAQLYRRRRALLRSFAFHFSSWTMGAGEIWLGLHFLGHPIGILEAIMLESLTQAVRSAAFIVPGGLGVQEGSYMLFGSTIGIGAETALALSLIKRVRELAIGIPALILWKLIEGQRLLRGA